MGCHLDFTLQPADQDGAEPEPVQVTGNSVADLVVLVQGDQTVVLDLFQVHALFSELRAKQWIS